MGISALSQRVNMVTTSKSADMQSPMSLVAHFRELVRRPRQWVWHGFVARRTLTLITGEPGVGKTVIGLQMAASVTRGLLVPVPPHNASKTFNVHAEMKTDPGDVLLLTAHDSLSDAVIEWIEASGADSDHLYFLRDHLEVDHQTTPAETEQKKKGGAAGWQQKLDRLEAAIGQLHEQGADLRMILIDPIEQILSPATRPTDRLQIVERLQQLAVSSGAAIVIIANSTPAGMGRNGFRSVSTGHLELATAARSVLMVAHDLEHLDLRLLIPVKVNLAPFRAGLSFRIEQIRDEAHPVTGSKVAVHWGEEPIAQTAQDYFQNAKALMRNRLILEEDDEISRASRWLKEQLSDGTGFASEIRNDAARSEISDATLNRAFHRLACRSIKIMPNKWCWRLPMEEYNSDQLRRDTRVEEKRKHRLHCAYEWEGSAPFDQTAVDELLERSRPSDDSS